MSGVADPRARTGLLKTRASGLLILLRGEEPQIEAEATTGSDRVQVVLREAPVTPSELPELVLHYVIRTRHSVILDDATAPTLFSTDPYMQQQRSRSVLCLPLTHFATGSSLG